MNLEVDPAPGFAKTTVDPAPVVVEVLIPKDSVGLK